MTYHTAWNEDVPPELREPFSYLSTSGESGMGRLRHPATELLFFGGMALACFAGAAYLAGNAPQNSRVVGPIMIGLLGVVFLVGVYIGLRRAAWVRRVKAATGMSPFEMERRGIAPPRAEQSPPS